MPRTGDEATWFAPKGFAPLVVPALFEGGLEVAEPKTNEALDAAGAGAILAKGFVLAGAVGAAAAGAALAKRLVLAVAAGAGAALVAEGFVLAGAEVPGGESPTRRFLLLRRSSLQP